MTQQTNITVPVAFMLQNAEFFRVEYDRTEKNYRIGKDIYPNQGKGTKASLQLKATRQNVWTLHPDIGNHAQNLHDAANFFKSIKVIKGDFIGRVWRGALLAARYMAGEKDLFTPNDTAVRRTATYWGEDHEIFGRTFYYLNIWASKKSYKGMCTCPDHHKAGCIVEFSTGEKQIICKHIVGLMLAAQVGAEFKDIDGRPINEAMLKAHGDGYLYFYQDGMPAPEFYHSKFNSYVELKGHAPANEETLISWIWQ